MALRRMGELEGVPAPVRFRGKHEPDTEERLGGSRLPRASAGVGRVLRRRPPSRGARGDRSRHTDARVPARRAPVGTGVARRVRRPPGGRRDPRGRRRRHRLGACRKLRSSTWRGRLHWTGRQSTRRYRRVDTLSRISRAEPDRVEVRGHDLAELMGRVTFTEYFHLLLTGREPTDDERFFLDLLLVAIAEHGPMPSNIAALMTLPADSSSLLGPVAGGILGAGPVIFGAAETCAVLLERAQSRVANG